MNNRGCIDWLVLPFVFIIYSIIRLVRKRKLGYKKCKCKCERACRFCIHWEGTISKDGLYADDGFCEWHKLGSGPYETCKHWVCKFCNSKIKGKGNK